MTQDEQAMAAGEQGASHWGDLPILGQDPTRTYHLGIMGGTFDPIHYGHLVAAESAHDQLDLDVVVFMPAGRPNFKQDKRVTSGDDRFAMTLAATRDNDHFAASRFEIDREGVTYTAETLRRLRDIYPPNVEFHFISGADAISEVVSWHDAGTIARLAHLVGATRPGYDLSDAEEAFATAPWDFDVTYLEVPALAISSKSMVCLGALPWLAVQTASLRVLPVIISFNSMKKQRSVKGSKM